jgi:acyl carrier protein
MPLERKIVATIVLDTLRELGEDLEKPELTDADESTRLFGARSSLDSMGLVNLIADIEERLSDDYEMDIALANPSAMSRTHSPFRRVSSCINYIMELITETEKK